MNSEYHLDDERGSLHGLQRRASETVMAVQGLLTTKSLNEVFSTRYRRRAGIAFFLYMILGIGYYCGQEKFTVLDAVYFSITTILTIG